MLSFAKNYVWLKLFQMYELADSIQVEFIRSWLDLACFIKVVTDFNYSSEKNLEDHDAHNLLSHPSYTS